MAANESLIGQILHDTYRVERLLGKGSMGTVYEASHLHLPRRFAIKVLLPAVAANPTALARFEREADVTSRLGHPHIVEVVDFQKPEEGSPYIVMELLEGQDLAVHLERLGRMEPEPANHILQQAASALQAAHDKGIIHRDLKPRNIFLGADDGPVKIVDFGISKVLGAHSDLTASANVFGTPLYMSPEQADGRHGDVDPRTDVYALGVILYEMLSGRPPFVGEAPLAILYKIVHQEPPPLGKLRPDLPDAATAVVHRALSKDPAARFESVAELARAFDQALRAGPGAAPAERKAPAPDIQATAKLPAVQARRRVPTLILVGASLVLLLVAVTILSMLLLDRGVPEEQPTPVRPEPVARPEPDAAAAPDARAHPDARPVDTRPAAPRPKRAKRAVRRVAPPEQPATLSVHTRHRGKLHWAVVFVDGARVGQSPVLKLPLAAGRHTVAVRRTGYKTKTVEVYLQPGANRTLTVTLDEQPASSQPEP